MPEGVGPADLFSKNMSIIEQWNIYILWVYTHIAEQHSRQCNFIHTYIHTTSIHTGSHTVYILNFFSKKFSMYTNTWERHRRWFFIHPYTPWHTEFHPKNCAGKSHLTFDHISCNTPSFSFMFQLRWIWYSSSYSFNLF